MVGGTSIAVMVREGRLSDVVELAIFLVPCSRCMEHVERTLSAISSNTHLAPLLYSSQELRACMCVTLIRSGGAGLYMSIASRGWSREVGTQ